MRSLQHIQADHSVVVAWDGGTALACGLGCQVVGGCRHIDRTENQGAVADFSQLLCHQEVVLVATWKFFSSDPELVEAQMQRVDCDTNLLFFLVSIWLF